MDKNAVDRRRPAVRWAVRALLAAGIIAATFWVFREPVRTEPFMGDETDWISSGNYYTALVLQGDFRHEAWVANHLGIVGNFNQNLGKVLLGLGVRWHPQRQPGDTDYLALYDWGKPYEINHALGQVPPPGLLLRARESEIVFVAGCAVLLFLAGTLISGEICGVLAAAIMLGSRTIQQILALAVTDSYYNFFILAGLVASVGLIRADKTRSFVGYSVLVGLAAGLACSVKITGLPVVAFFYCLLLPPIWVARGFALRTTVYGPLAALCTAIFTVYLLNPFFWPFESPRMLLEFPNLYARTRQAFGSVPPEALGWGTPPERMKLIHERLFLSGYRSVWVEPFAFASGLLFCGGHLVRGLRTRELNLLGLAFVYFVAQYVFVVALVQFNFARYFLPVMFSMKLLAAIGVAAPIYWIWSRIRSRTRVDKPAVEATTPPNEGETTPASP